MKKIFEVHDVRFVITKDELGYQEVLDDFPNSSHIYILTYNISQSNDDLLCALKKCGDKSEIVVISNIPQRWTTYFGNTYAENARKKIQIYKSRLDPKKISEKAEIYFCFDNHAKIIMTDNIVYVGSSNYADESSHNFESGFISTDIDFIEFLKNEIIPWIIDYSSEYSTDEALLLTEVALNKSIAIFEEVYEEFRCCFYHLNDHRGMEWWYYNTTEPTLRTNNIEHVNELLTKYSELLQKANIYFEYPIIIDMGIKDIEQEMDRLDSIIETITGLFDGDIGDLASFNAQDIFDDYINEHYGDAYDEYLNEYMDSAIDLANDKFADLAETVRESTDYLLINLNLLIELSKDVLGRYRELPKKEILIDNTK